MKPGPPPKPTALKLLAGNPGRRPLNDREPQPPRGRPKCPRWLSKDARTVWKDLVPLLDNMGVLTLVDRNALVRYCWMFGEWLKYAQELQTDGHIKPDALTPGPRYRLVLQLDERLGKLEREFGLTPAARVSLKASFPGETEMKPPVGKRRFLNLPG